MAKNILFFIVSPFLNQQKGLCCIINITLVFTVVIYFLFSASAPNYVKTVTPKLRLGKQFLNLLVPTLSTPPKIKNI